MRIVKKNPFLKRRDKILNQFRIDPGIPKEHYGFFVTDESSNRQSLEKSVILGKNKHRDLPHEKTHAGATRKVNLNPRSRTFVPNYAEAIPSKRIRRNTMNLQQELENATSMLNDNISDPGSLEDELGMTE